MTFSEIFLTFKDSLGADAYFDKKKQADNILVEMYHKSTHQDSKERKLTEFKSGSSRIRCIITTVALGMGLDIQDVQLVVHIGCPKSILSYWQEAGRCARDGRQGFSLILFDGFTLALKTTDKDLAAVVKNDSKTCIRKLILETLGDESMSILCPKLLHVKDATYKSARVLLVNVVQYAKRGANLMYIHFYLHEGTSPVNEDCLARRL